MQDRWRSESPRGNEDALDGGRLHQEDIDNIDGDTIIGAPVSDWFSYILRHPAQRDVLRQAMHFFTQYNIRVQDDESEDGTQFVVTLSEDGTLVDIEENYIECIFAARTGTFHNVYTGPNGGKYFFKPNHQIKYIRNTGLRARMVDPDETEIVDNNPALIGVAENDEDESDEDENDEE